MRYINLLSRTLFTASLITTTVGYAGVRPNIILFMVDDMGWQDTSVSFWEHRTPYNERYETPNMEKLAQQGMIFTQAYASSISSPTRCSLMTGSNAARHRVTNWTLQKNHPTDETSESLILPQWNWNGIAEVEGTPNTYVAKSFVQLLREHGYHTIHCGKAHWGAIDTPGENPAHFGFEINISGNASGGPASYLSEFNYGHDAKGTPTSLHAIPGLEHYWGTGTFATEALTQEALKALDKAKAYGQPFYLYMSHYAIHVPIDKDPRFYDKYKRKGLSDKEAAYASLIEGMDKSLGDIMEWLDRNGEVGHTVLIFMSDNGGYTTGTHWRDAPLYVHNAPLKCGKGSAYEGGIREPMIVRWPGVVHPATRCNDYLIIEDFYPTLLEMAGISHYKVPQIIDGRSFMPMLTGRGTSSKGRALYWNVPNIWDNSGPGIGPTCTIRKDDWKMIYFYRDGHKELYNIREDISENHNLAASQPRLLSQLSKDLSDYLRRSGAQRPSFKDTGKPCPWPDEIE